MGIIKDSRNPSNPYSVRSSKQRSIRHPKIRGPEGDHDNPPGEIELTIAGASEPKISKTGTGGPYKQRPMPEIQTPASRGDAPKYAKR